MNDNRSIDDIRQNLENILYGYYIKYNKLQELVNQGFVNTDPSDVIDIYVDLYDMLHPIYGRDIYTKKQFVIVSSIINLAAHIRGYFSTRYKMWARIFLVYANNTSFNHKQFYQSFGNDDIRLTLNYEKNANVVNTQLELVKILAAYINDVYFVRKNTMFSMFVYDNIKNNQKIPAIVWSKSVYTYQIPALLSNTVVFRPKKYMGEDNSIAVSNTNTLRRYFSKLTNTTSLKQLVEINPELLSLLIAMTGINECGMNSLLNSTKAIRILHEAITKGQILNKYNYDSDYVYSVIPELARYIDQTNFSFRFKAIDLVFQHMLYSQMPESKDYLWQINLNDPETVRNINNQYFAGNPLDLNSL